jgi:hypothetical protein
MFVGSSPSGNQRVVAVSSWPSQPETVRKNAIRPPPDTSCMTWPRVTLPGWMPSPAPDAIRTAVSTIVSRSAS